MAEPRDRVPSLTPFRVAGIFAVFSWAWILGTSWLVHAWSHSAAWTTTDVIEVSKGLGFVSGTALLLYALMRRMTGQLMAQRNALIVSEQRYRELFDAVPEPTWLFDEETLRFLEVNQAACTSYGWTREEFLRMTLRDIRPPEDVPDLERRLAEQRNQTLHDVTTRHLTRDGRLFPARVRSAAVNIMGKRVRMGVTVNVEELVRARESVQQANLELQQLNESLEKRIEERTEKLKRAVAELDWFGEAVSHDLKQPVGHLRVLATELALTTRDRLTPPEMEMLYRMVGASGRLEHLVDELLEYARAEGTEQVENLSLVLIVSEALGQLRRECGDSCRVTLEEPLYWVRAHRPTLIRVITALLRMGMVSAEGASGGLIVVSATRSNGRITLKLDCDAALVEETARQMTVGVGRSARVGIVGGMAVVLRSVSRMDGTLKYVPGASSRGAFTLELPAADGMH